MAAAADLSGAAAAEKYRELATTAESGWDFSSRWGAKTTHIIPVDLNCFLFMMEQNMQRFAQASHSAKALMMAALLLLQQITGCHRFPVVVESET